MFAALTCRSYRVGAVTRVTDSRRMPALLFPSQGLQEVFLFDLPQFCPDLFKLCSNLFQSLGRTKQFNIKQNRVIHVA